MWWWTTIALYGDLTVKSLVVGGACAASTVSFATLAQMFNMAAIRYLLEHGQSVTVFVSANVG